MIKSMESRYFNCSFWVGFTHLCYPKVQNVPHLKRVCKACKAPSGALEEKGPKLKVWFQTIHTFSTSLKLII